MARALKTLRESRVRARSLSKMPINMASTFSKFVHRKGCVNLLQFQNIYRPNTYPSLLDLKEKSMRYVGVST